MGGFESLLACSKGFDWVFPVNRMKGKVPGWLNADYYFSLLIKRTLRTKVEAVDISNDT